MIRSWICHNHKFYYTYVILCAMGVYNFWWNTCVGYYRRRNYHRSLDFAIQREQEWKLNKPPEEDEEDYGEEDYGAEAPAEGGEAPAEGEGGGNGEEEE